MTLEQRHKGGEREPHSYRSEELPRRGERRLQRPRGSILGFSPTRTSEEAPVCGCVCSSV